MVAARRLHVLRARTIHGTEKNGGKLLCSYHFVSCLCRIGENRKYPQQKAETIASEYIILRCAESCALQYRTQNYGNSLLVQYGKTKAASKQGSARILGGTSSRCQFSLSFVVSYPQNPPSKSNEHKIQKVPSPTRHDDDNNNAAARTALPCRCRVGLCTLQRRNGGRTRLLHRRSIFDGGHSACPTTHDLVQRTAHSVGPAHCDYESNDEPQQQRRPLEWSDTSRTTTARYSTQSIGREGTKIYQTSEREPPTYQS